MDPINLSLKAERKFIDSSQYKFISRKISNVHKRVLNCETIEKPLVKLEKEAIRGCTTERSEPRPTRKSINKPSFLSLILKSEHKITPNACIIKLPKMPFGKHRDYNNEIQFVSKHFLNTTRVLSKEQNEDLNEITKKFRLDDKNKQGVKRNKTGYVKCRNSPKVNTFNMEHGNLVCKIETGVLEGYDHDKEKYRKYLYEPISMTQRGSARNIDKTLQEQSVDRLHNSFKQNDTNLSLFFKTKYSGLFSKTGLKQVNSNSFSIFQND